MAHTDVIMPQMGESITEATLTKWHKKPGDPVKREEILFEISTDKVDSEIPSPADGVLAEILFPTGSVVPVHAVVARLAPTGAAVSAPSAGASTPAPQAATPPPPPPVAAAIPSAPTPAAAPAAGDKRLLSSPLVRKMAAEHHVDLSQVAGSGESGRITKADLQQYMATKAQTITQAPLRTATAEQLATTGGSLAGLIDGVRAERVPMTPMRKKIAEHMVFSKHTSPHVTSVIEIDVQKIVDIRAKAKDKFEAQHGFKLTFMPFFLQAALEAIRAVPIVNASVEGDTIIYKKDVNLGVAVALDWGLIVPVIKSAQEKNFVGLGRGLNDLAEKARNKKLAPDDVKGGTFSISNFGGFGTIIGQPIINQPQVAIMGIGAMTKKPVVVNDAIAIRTMVYVVLSFDHRIIDGSNSGKFLSTVKNCLENWNLPVL